MILVGGKHYTITEGEFAGLKACAVRPLSGDEPAILMSKFFPKDRMIPPAPLREATDEEVSLFLFLYPELAGRSQMCESP